MSNGERVCIQRSLRETALIPFDSISDWNNTPSGSRIVMAGSSERRRIEWETLISPFLFIVGISPWSPSAFMSVLLYIRRRRFCRHDISLLYETSPFRITRKQVGRPEIKSPGDILSFLDGTMQYRHPWYSTLFFFVFFFPSFQAEWLLATFYVGIERRINGLLNRIGSIVGKESCDLSPWQKKKKKNDFVRPFPTNVVRYHLSPSCLPEKNLTKQEASHKAHTGLI
jgi:hypothetical protein